MRGLTLCHRSASAGPLPPDTSLDSRLRGNDTSGSCRVRTTHHLFCKGNRPSIYPIYGHADQNEVGWLTELLVYMWRRGKAGRGGYSQIESEHVEFSTLGVGVQQ